MAHRDAMTTEDRLELLVAVARLLRLDAARLDEAARSLVSSGWAVESGWLGEESAWLQARLHALVHGAILVHEEYLRIQRRVKPSDDSAG